MRIDQLNLTNFKNYNEISFDFSTKINVFVGDNGVGKTNVLDALYYLSFCKSYFNPIDSQNINHDENFFAIKGNYTNSNEGNDVILCSMKRNEKKKISLNKKDYERFSDHIGLFPLVIISPSDSQMIYNGSEERRRYFDSVISQFDRTYLEHLISYQKVLQQRNAMLKQFAAKDEFDTDSLDVWDEQLAHFALPIFNQRTEFLQQFIPLMQKYYSFVSNERETVSIEYNSQVNQGNFLDKIKSARRKDLAFGHTTLGIHRDEIKFLLSDFSLRKFGSQGQQKSFLVALKLAQFDYTYTKKGFKPMLLLDDIFDKLDHSRVEQLLKLVSRNEFGQIFITDTDSERMHRIFEDMEVETSIFEIIGGKISTIKST